MMDTLIDQYIRIRIQLPPACTYTADICTDDLSVKHSAMPTAAALSPLSPASAILHYDGALQSDCAVVACFGRNTAASALEQQQQVQSYQWKTYKEEQQQQLGIKQCEKRTECPEFGVDVALHETPADLRGVLFELLPSCFFTNYVMQCRGKTLTENESFSQQGMRQNDLLQLIPLPYDSTALRLHLQRFRAIALPGSSNSISNGSKAQYPDLRFDDAAAPAGYACTAEYSPSTADSLLIMKEIPNPNDPAGPYGAFLKPLVLRQQQQQQKEQLLLNKGLSSDQFNDPSFQQQQQLLLPLPSDEDNSCVSDVESSSIPVLCEKLIHSCCSSTSSKDGQSVPQAKDSPRLPHSIGREQQQRQLQGQKAGDWATIEENGHILREKRRIKQRHHLGSKGSSSNTATTGKRKSINLKKLIFDDIMDLTSDRNCEAATAAAARPSDDKNAAILEFPNAQAFNSNSSCVGRLHGQWRLSCESREAKTPTESAAAAFAAATAAQQRRRLSKRREVLHEVLLRSPGTTPLNRREKCVARMKLLQVFGANSAERYRGYLALLDVVTLEQQQLAVFCREEGFTAVALQAKDSATPAAAAAPVNSSCNGKKTSTANSHNNTNSSNSSTGPNNSNRKRRSTNNRRNNSSSNRSSSVHAAYGKEKTSIAPTAADSAAATAEASSLLRTAAAATYVAKNGAPATAEKQVYFSLSDLLAAWSPLFVERMQCFTPEQLDADLPYRLMPQLQTYYHFLLPSRSSSHDKISSGRCTEHRFAGMEEEELLGIVAVAKQGVLNSREKENKNSFLPDYQEALLLAAASAGESDRYSHAEEERSWLDELDILRSIKKATLQQQLDFEKGIFKLYYDFQQVALHAAMQVSAWLSPSNCSNYTSSPYNDRSSREETAQQPQQQKRKVYNWRGLQLHAVAPVQWPFTTQLAQPRSSSFSSSAQNDNSRNSHGTINMRDKRGAAVVAEKSQWTPTLAAAAEAAKPANGSKALVATGYRKSLTTSPKAFRASVRAVELLERLHAFEEGSFFSSEQQPQHLLTAHHQQHVQQQQQLHQPQPYWRLRAAYVMLVDYEGKRVACLTPPPSLLMLQSGSSCSNSSSTTGYNGNIFQRTTEGDGDGLCRKREFEVCQVAKRRTAAEERFSALKYRDTEFAAAAAEHLLDERVARVLGLKRGFCSMSVRENPPLLSEALRYYVVDDRRRVHLLHPFMLLPKDVSDELVNKENNASVYPFASATGIARAAAARSAEPVVVTDSLLNHTTEKATAATLNDAVSSVATARAAAAAHAEPSGFFPIPDAASATAPPAATSAPAAVSSCSSQYVDGTAETAVATGEVVKLFRPELIAAYLRWTLERQSSAAAAPAETAPEKERDSRFCGEEKNVFKASADTSSNKSRQVQLLPGEKPATTDSATAVAEGAEATEPGAAQRKATTPRDSAENLEKAPFLCGGSVAYDDTPAKVEKQPQIASPFALELQCRSQKEIARRLPLIMSGALACMRTWCKEDAGLGLLESRGSEAAAAAATASINTDASSASSASSPSTSVSAGVVGSFAVASPPAGTAVSRTSAVPHSDEATTVREKVHAIMEQVLLQCLLLSKALQRAAFLEQRELLQQQQQQHLGEQVERSDEREECKEKLQQREKQQQQTTEKRSDMQPAFTSTAETAETATLLTELDPGIDSGALQEREKKELELFHLSAEDVELLKQLPSTLDVSLLGKTVDIAAQSKHMAKELCELTFAPSVVAGSTCRCCAAICEETTAPRALLRPHKQQQQQEQIQQEQLQQQQQQQESAAFSYKQVKRVYTPELLTGSAHEAAEYLQQVAIPLLSDVLSHYACSLPLESSSLKEVFHYYGVNLRYLGAVASYIERHFVTTRAGLRVEAPVAQAASVKAVTAATAAPMSHTCSGDEDANRHNRNSDINVRNSSISAAADKSSCKTEEELRREDNGSKHDSNRACFVVEVLLVEMTVRAATHCFTAVFSRLRKGQLAAAAAHLLNCLLCPAGAQYPSKQHPMPRSLIRSVQLQCSISSKMPRQQQQQNQLERAEEELAETTSLVDFVGIQNWWEITSESLWQSIGKRMREYFNYSHIPADKEKCVWLQKPCSRYRLLRGVCTAVGLQLTADQEFFEFLSARPGLCIFEGWFSPATGAASAAGAGDHVKGPSLRSVKRDTCTKQQVSAVACADVVASATEQLQQLQMRKQNQRLATAQCETQGQENQHTYGTPSVELNRKPTKAAATTAAGEKGTSEEDAPGASPAAAAFPSVLAILERTSDESTEATDQEHCSSTSSSTVAAAWGGRSSSPDETRDSSSRCSSSPLCSSSAVVETCSTSEDREANGKRKSGNCSESGSKPQWGAVAAVEGSAAAATMKPPLERQQQQLQQQVFAKEEEGAAAAAAAKPVIESCWLPLPATTVARFVPVVKSQQVVSPLTKALLAAATEAYVLGWLDVALELCQQALYIIHQLVGAVCREAALCYAAIGHVTMLLQDYLNAANNFQKALILTERCLGVEHPANIELHAVLSKCLIELPGAEYKERGLAHVARSLQLLQLWTGAAALVPEQPVLMLNAARCMLNVYGPICAHQLPLFLNAAAAAASSRGGSPSSGIEADPLGAAFVAELHSDISHIYQACEDYKNALQHCRRACQLLAISNTPVDEKRLTESEEQLLFLTHQAVQAAKKTRGANKRRAELLQRLRTVVHIKRLNPR